MRGSAIETSRSRNSYIRAPRSGGADDPEVRRLERRRLLDDAAGDDLRAAHPARVLDRARPLVPLDQVDVLHEDTILLRQRLDHAPPLAAVLAGEHLDGVAR